MQINSTQKNGKSSFVVGICGGTRSTLPPTAIRPPSKMILNQKHKKTSPKKKGKNWKIALGCTQLQPVADALNDVVENLTGKKVGHYFLADILLGSFLI